MGAPVLRRQLFKMKFERYENVLVAKLTGFEEIDRYVEGTSVYRTYAGLLDVEKVYKGNASESRGCAHETKSMARAPASDSMQVAI